MQINISLSITVNSFSVINNNLTSFDFNLISILISNLNHISGFFYIDTTMKDVSFSCYPKSYLFIVLLAWVCVVSVFLLVFWFWYGFRASFGFYPTKND